MHVLVMAKAPVAGRVKTRMCPPCTPVQAAALAEAALADTLDAVAACGAERRLLALKGEPGPWLPAGFEVFAQCGDGLDERLAHAWSVAGGPGLQIGMDTPQLDAGTLDAACATLLTPGTDAVLGPATDGGWWGIGLRWPSAAMFLGVPMSTTQTGAAQVARLEGLGLRVGSLPSMTDIDDIASAHEVATQIPGSRTAGVVATLPAGVAV